MINSKHRGQVNNCNRNGNTYSSAGDATCQIDNFVRRTTLSTSSEMLKLSILQPTLCRCGIERLGKEEVKE